MHMPKRGKVLGKEAKKFIHPNPVFQAFDDAKGVDDLYRIAEIYVNPASYYQLEDDL